jgi:leader peptidase (prepilin peptidase)/N-methyltransferase
METRDQVVAAVGALATIGLLVAFRSDLVAGIVTAVVTAVSTWLAIIDFREHRLPNRIVIPLAGFATVGVLVLGLVDDDLGRAIRAVAIAMAVFAVLFVLGLVGGIGMGDVKYSYPLTAVLAWFGSLSLQTALLAMVLAAGVYTIVQLIRTRSAKMMIAFGPFMAIGFVAGALVAA